jgi:DNA-directed RNA polymerase specialized sigma24 family protein
MDAERHSMELPDTPVAYPLALKYTPYLKSCFLFDNHESLSVVDDVSLKMKRKLGTAIPDKNLLFVAIKNCAINHAESKNRHWKKRAEVDMNLLESRTTPCEIDDVTRAVAELTGVTPDEEECRILWMLAFEGADFDTIGRDLNISPGAARQKLYLFRRRCRAQAKQSA